MIKMIKDKKYSKKFWKEYSDCKRKLPHSDLVYRTGPAPKNEWNGTKNVNVKKVKYNYDFIGNLDCSDFKITLNDTEIRKKSSATQPVNEIKNNDVSSSMEDEEKENTSKYKKGDTDKTKDDLSVAGSRAILIYFARMSLSSSVERLDYDFLFTLLQHGAEINISDRLGQTVMHEVARNWNTDVAEFMIRFGADVNIPDKWGRTPLHIAAATNHAVMIKCLISNGADPNARTFEENQSVLHYAAKYDAISSLKVLVDLRVNYNVRDYKGRTPFLLAAEMAQEGTVSFLLDLGLGVGVYDDTGMAAIGHMIEKMPQIAYEALSQYICYDNRRRKTLYYLNYLERDPNQWNKDQEIEEIHEFWGETIEEPTEEDIREKKKTRCPTTPLEIAVNHVELNIIMHPVMQALIRTKWKQFGQYGAYAKVIIHLVYVTIWSVNAFFYPRDGKYYTKQNKNIYWRLPIDLFCLIIASYFTLQLIMENKIFYKATKNFSNWRRRQICRDIEFCHPGWSLEKTFLENEIKDLASSSKQEKVINPWNITEFIAYVLVICVVSIRVLNVQVSNGIIDSIHTRCLVVSLLLLWMKFLKLFQVFPTIGTFFIMVGYAIRETLSFAILFILLAAPYTAGFWIIAQEKEQKENRNFNDVIYVTWLVTLNNVSLSALTLDKTMGQLMFACCFALISIICFNMYIGLLTETFYKVYLNAKAHASREQALSILKLEKLLKEKTKQNYDEKIQDNCGPKESQPNMEFVPITEAELWKRVTYNVTNRIDRLKDDMKAFKSPKQKIKAPKEERNAKEIDEEALYKAVVARDQELYSLRLSIYELKCMIYEYLHLDRGHIETPKYDPLPDVFPSQYSPFDVQNAPTTFTPPGYPVTPNQKDNVFFLAYNSNDAGIPQSDMLNQNYPPNNEAINNYQSEIPYVPYYASPFVGNNPNQYQPNQYQQTYNQYSESPHNSRKRRKRPSLKTPRVSKDNSSNLSSKDNSSNNLPMNLVISNDKHGNTVLQPIMHRAPGPATIHSYLAGINSPRENEPFQSQSYPGPKPSSKESPLVLPTMYLSNFETNKVSISSDNSYQNDNDNRSTLSKNDSNQEFNDSRKSSDNQFVKDDNQKIRKNSKDAFCQVGPPLPLITPQTPPPSYCSKASPNRHIKSNDLKSSNLFTESMSSIRESKESLDDISVCSKDCDHIAGSQKNVSDADKCHHKCKRISLQQRENSPVHRQKGSSICCEQTCKNEQESPNIYVKQPEPNLRILTPSKRYQEAVKLLNRRRSFDEPMVAKQSNISRGACCNCNNIANMTNDCSHSNVSIVTGSSSDSFPDEEHERKNLGQAIPEDAIDDSIKPDRHLSIKLWTHYANAVPGECEGENPSQSDQGGEEEEGNISHQHINCNVKIKRDFTTQRKSSDSQINTCRRNSYSSFTSDNRRCSVNDACSSSSTNTGNEMKKTSSNPGDGSTFFLQQSDNELFRTIMMLKMSVNALKYKCEPRSGGGSSSVNDDEII